MNVYNGIYEMLNVSYNLYLVNENIYPLTPFVYKNA